MVLISDAVRQRLVSGQFVPERQTREHPYALFKGAIRLETAVFTNRLEQLLTLLDALNNPSVTWVNLSGGFGLGKTSLARALAECVPVEQTIWLETPPDVEQFSAHLAKAFHQPDINLFEAIRQIKTDTLIVLNRADNLLSAQGRWQLPEQHKPVISALLQNPFCRVVWCGTMPPPHDGPMPLNIHLGPLNKADVKTLLSRVMSQHTDVDPMLLIQLSQGHPWRVRLLWRLLKSSQHTALIKQLSSATEPMEMALLLHYAQSWDKPHQLLVGLLATAEYPLSLTQLAFGLKSAYPGVSLDVKKTVEQSPLTPFIQRITPVQLAHNRQDIDSLALYQIIPLIKNTLKQVDLPWQACEQGIKAICTMGLEKPATASHISTRHLRKMLQNSASANPQLEPTDLDSTKKQLQLAINQGHVLRQLQLLELMAATYQQQNKWDEATRVLNHTLSLAMLTDNPDWSGRAWQQLQLVVKHQS